MFTKELKRQCRPILLNNHVLILNLNLVMYSTYVKKHGRANMGTSGLNVKINGTNLIQNWMNESMIKRLLDSAVPVGV